MKFQVSNIEFNSECREDVPEEHVTFIITTPRGSAKFLEWVNGNPLDGWEIDAIHSYLRRHELESFLSLFEWSCEAEAALSEIYTIVERYLNSGGTRV